MYVYKMKRIVWRNVALLVLQSINTRIIKIKNKTNPLSEKASKAGVNLRHGKGSGIFWIACNNQNQELSKSVSNRQ